MTDENGHTHKLAECHECDGHGVNERDPGWCESCHGKGYHEVCLVCGESMLPRLTRITTDEKSTVSGTVPLSDDDIVRMALYEYERVVASDALRARIRELSGAVLDGRRSLGHLPTGDPTGGVTTHDGSPPCPECGAHRGWS